MKKVNLKRVSSLMLILASIASFTYLPVTASAPNDFTVENGVLTEYNGPGGDVVIPGDMGIKEIGKAFYFKTNISSVLIPQEVTAINDEAFWGCTLRAVTIPDSLLTIGENAFCGCEKLKSVIIPRALSEIKQGAFCRTGLESVTITESVTVIGNRAFCNCKDLKSVTFMNDGVNVGDGVFCESGLVEPILINGRSTLCYVPASFSAYSIPDTVTTIRGSSFKDNCNLTDIDIPGNVNTIGGAAFMGCTGLKSVRIREGVRTIGDGAFKECKSLMSVSLPKSVSSVGNMAFYKSGITEPVFTYEGSALLYVPVSTTEYTVPDSVEIINGGAFAGCAKLSSVKIPDGLTDVGNMAFYNCESLTEMSLPLSLRSIGNEAFMNCLALTSVNIPDGVTSIGNYAFASCRSLTSPMTVPDGITTVSAGMFQDCGKLTSIKLPESVTSIGQNAFGACGSLTSITIPKGTASIGHWAFGECGNLTSITIPDGVTAIDYTTFIHCRSLKTAYIPASVTSIAQSAFEGCESLTIYSATGSFAESYAIKNKIPFLPITKYAAPTGSVVTVNGKEVKFEAYNIDDNNYFKLRDLAMALSATGKQFNVIWDPGLKAIDLISGEAYEPVGGELTVTARAQNAEAVFSAPYICLDGKQISLSAYEIDGYNYVKLRDLAEVINFGVTYDAAADSIAINTAGGYSA